VLHAIIPVRFNQQGSGRTITAYDNGSSGRFLTEDLLHQLEAVATTLYLRTMHDQSITNTMAATGLIVSSLNGDNPIELPKSFA